MHPCRQTAFPAGRRMHVGDDWSVTRAGAGLNTMGPHEKGCSEIRELRGGPGWQPASEEGDLRPTSARD